MFTDFEWVSWPRIAVACPFSLTFSVLAVGRPVLIPFGQFSRCVPYLFHVSGERFSCARIFHVTSMMAMRLSLESFAAIRGYSWHKSTQSIKRRWIFRTLLTLVSYPLPATNNMLRDGHWYAQKIICGGALFTVSSRVYYLLIHIEANKGVVVSLIGWVFQRKPIPL